MALDHDFFLLNHGKKEIISCSGYASCIGMVIIVTLTNIVGYHTEE